MPAVVSSTDWSSAEGTSEAEGTAMMPALDEEVREACGGSRRMS